MRRTQPTVQQARDRFDIMLAAALRGEQPQVESGLDTDIEDLMREIANAHPELAPALIEQARALLAQQVSAIENPPTETQFIAELAKRFPDIALP